MDNKERTDKENEVIRRMARKLRTTLLKQEPIMIGKRPHRFDFASKDHSIVGEVKTSEPNKQNPDGPLRSALKGDLCRDCLVLLAAKKAKKRILVLTNQTVYEKFMYTEYGQAAKVLGIDVRPINLGR
jgi:hypothetical protein